MSVTTISPSLILLLPVQKYRRVLDSGNARRKPEVELKKLFLRKVCVQIQSVGSDSCHQILSRNLRSDIIVIIIVIVVFIVGVSVSVFNIILLLLYYYFIIINIIIMTINKFIIFIQKWFSMSVESILEISNIQNEMRGVQDRIKFLRNQL